MTKPLFLTRVAVNPRRRGAVPLLNNSQAMHAAVLACFPPESLDGGRVLWRVERHHNGVDSELVVLSPVRPDMSPIVEQAGWSTAPAETVEYTGVVDHCVEGQTVLFDLVANPTRCVRGKRCEINGTEGQLEWLSRKGELHGFEVMDAQVVSVANRRGRRAGSGRLTHSLVRFRGQLRVTDSERFADAVAGGIGRAKAYGAGMMLIAPWRVA